MSEKEQKVKSSTTFGRGIKQAARWVARMFGYKAENKYARGLWYVFATSATIVALFAVVVITIVIVENVGYFIDDYKYRRMTNAPTYLHDYNNTYVSPYVVHHDYFPNYLYNMKTGRRTLTGINWICKSSDGDSLACFSASVEGERKRGYFNIFTGEAVIPAQYDKAWIFSEGLACVYDKGMVHFIDHKGQLVINKEFPYTPRIDDYCFHNGLCSILGDNNRIGLIDKQGNWVVEPEYYQMSYDTKGFWLVQDREWNYGLLDAKGQLLLPIEYKDIAIHDEDCCIYVCRLDHLDQVLDFNCNVINPCNFNDAEKMYYETGEFDKDGELEYASANNLKYRTSEWYYGLMDRNGNIVTPPSYSHIEAIGSNRYQCVGSHGTVILDDKGNECGEKQ